MIDFGAMSPLLKLVRAGDPVGEVPHVIIMLPEVVVFFFSTKMVGCCFYLSLLVARSTWYVSVLFSSAVWLLLSGGKRGKKQQ